MNNHAELRIIVSVAKRFMAEPTTPPQMTARYLRAFEGFSTGRDGDVPRLDASVIAAIGPMDDDGYELYREIVKLVPKRDDPVDPAQRARDYQPAWKSMTENFPVFANLNPSLSAGSGAS